MSVSSLPEWKQLLLEKKRREEEERERREKEEEEKFANMPAWKRGIIQRRKARQESLGDREKDRDVCLLQVDARSPSDGLSDTDSSVTVNLGSELSLSPDPGLWLDTDPKPESQVSVETIVPLHENPFIRTQSAKRKSRDADVGYQERANEVEVKEKDKMTSRGHDGESGRGRDIELKIERFRDFSEGREKERSRDRSQGRETNREAWERDKGSWKESGKDALREKEFLKVRKDEEDKETDTSFAPLASCLRTIHADNIIIIEQDRRCSDERRGKWREVDRPDEDHQGKRGMKMDLREILAGGGSVTEIRASDVVIIKPSASAEERDLVEVAGGKVLGRADGEVKGIVDGRRDGLGRELRTDISWLREKENIKEKERPCGQATVIKDDKKDSLDDNVFVERGGRVSQLLSKFGEHPKPPSRSKSSDNFLRPARRKYSGDQDDQQSEESKTDRRSILLKGVPKRSFSFSDRVISAKENGLDGEGCFERKTRDKMHSDKSMVPWVNIAGLGRETKAKIKLGCARLLDKDRFGKHKDVKNEDENVEKRGAEKAIDGDEGFTVAFVQNTEGISFARRVPIKQDGKARPAERQVKRLSDDRGLPNVDVGRQTEAQVCDKKALESTIPAETFSNYITDASAISPLHTAESYNRPESGFTECSSLLSTVTDVEATWSNTPGVYSVLSQQTEELISKIEKIGDTTLYSSEKASRAAHEMTKESKQEGHTHSDDSVLRSPKRTTPMGIPPGPLEIQIPRTVFYVAEEIGKSNEGQGVERRDSWRIGKPLSRIESLREKIRQRELERRRQREAEVEDESEGAEVADAQTAADKCDETENKRELEAAADVQKRMVDTGQEDTEAQTSLTAFDVTQEVSVLQTCPQLPVPAPQSEADRGEEVASSFEVNCFQISEDEEDALKDVEEELRVSAESKNGERQEEEEKELSIEEEEESPVDLLPLSPSPPHPNSLTAMSRIYNLETVGSRSGLCLRERRVDISPVHLVKVKPLISNAQQGDRNVFPGEDICGVQTIQRQIEQFQLTGQEHVASTSSNTLLKVQEAKGWQSKGMIKHSLKDDVKIQEKETSETNPKLSPQGVCSPTSQLQQFNQTVPITPSFRSQSPDKSPKTSDCAPTPVSSPCSPSPVQSPSLSPSPSPSPTLFSIKSISGGHVKRGATITITPKKPVGGGGGGRGTTPATAKNPQQQAPVTSTVAEPTKKRYPAVEEIEVIGGYQNLEKSCLVKGKGTPKRGKVCFDEDKLEQVCEYPSETSMLACTLYPHDLGRTQGEETQGEDVDGGPVVSKSSRSVGISTGRGLRVDESCPR